MIWCEDQGPLAFLGPEVRLPHGIESLACGDQITFSIELRDEVRFVRDVYVVTPGEPGSDPRDILARYHHGQDAASHLRVVA